MAAPQPSHHAGDGSVRSDEPKGWWPFVCSTNHKAIGTLYLVFAIVAGLVGGFLPLAMNVALMEPGPQILSGPHPVNVFATGHGLIMVFFTVIPAMIGGFGNWFVPLMIGAPEMAFPRMNRISFWLLPLSFALLTLSITMEGGSRGEVGGGWAVYVPLTTYTSQGAAMDLAIFSLHIAGVSLILSAINFITTIFNQRAPEMALHKMPLFIWSILVTSFLLLLSLPVLAGTIAVVLANHHFGSMFTGIAIDADPIPYQHLYWFFGHPEIYILILPGFGVVSQIVATFSKKPIVASLSIAYAMVAIGVISFVVWAQYLYTAGLAGDPKGAFVFTTLVLAVLTGISIFCWIATMWAGALTFRAPMLWATGYMFLFAVGGATGVALATASADAAVADAYYVVAHLHYLLSLGAVCAFFAGWYYWFPKISGILYNEALAKPQFWLTFVGVTLMALPGYLGLAGLEGRAVDSPATVARWNDLTLLGSTVLGAAVAVFLLCMAEAFFRKRPAGRNPWGAGATTLEWS